MNCPYPKNPILKQAFDADWYYPPNLPPEITNHRDYEQAYNEGWHEWIETELDWEAVKRGFTYDLSRDLDGRPIYWINGHWQTHDGGTVEVTDEEDALAYVGRGDHMMRFCESFMRFTKAPRYGDPYRFLPWMRKLVAPLFGWVKPDSEYKIRRYRFLLCEIAKKNAKALAHDTPIPTPSGWKNHGDLIVGDELFDARGDVTTVVAVHPETEIDYEIKFTNGEVVRCNSDHLWVTESLRREYAQVASDGSVATKLRRGATHYYPATTKSTLEILRTLETSQSRSHRVKYHDGLEIGEADLPIDPYILGYWLGDGTSSSASISIGHQDIDAFKMSALTSITDYRLRVTTKGRKNPYYTVRIAGLQVELRRNNLLGNKHIPAKYLRASKAQRLSLLQGLMDSDGTISKDGKCICFTQKNERVARQFGELLSSLGIKYRSRLKPYTCTNSAAGRVSCEAWHIQFHVLRDTHEVFRYKRKLDRMRTRSDLVMSTGRSRHVHIKAIRPIDPVRGNCITVASKDGTYLCGKTMIPTHNSALVSAIANYMLLADGTPKAEVYIGACDRNQAGIIYREAANYVRESPQLSELAEIIESRSRIVDHNSASFLQVISADAHRNDGYDSSFTGIDEIHRHPNRKLFDVMERAGKARPQPLMVVITTYGPSTTDGSIWAELHNEGKAQFAGERPNTWRNMYFCASAEPIAVTATADVAEGETIIPVIRVEQPIDVGPIEFDLSHVAETGSKAKVEIAEPVKRFQTFIKVRPLEIAVPQFSEAMANNDWCNLHGVHRANPSADVIFPAQETLDSALAIRSPIHEAETKQLDFNIVSGSGQRAISAAIWKANGEMLVQPKKLIGMSAYGGMDFAFSNDLVALSITVPKWDVSVPFIDVQDPRADLLSWVWLAEDGIEDREEREDFPYRHYAKQPYLFDDKGCIRFCEGRVVDFTQIAEEALEIISQFAMIAVAYDPNYAQFGINKLIEQGVVCVEHRQSKQYMGPSTKQLLKMVCAVQLAHGHNPVLDRAVEGAVLDKADGNGNRKFSKEHSKNRIDPLVGHVMSLGFATNPPVAQSGAWANSETGVWGTIRN